MLVCDLHGYYLNEVLDQILESVRLCWILKDPYLRIIHGYSHGHRLKDYIQSPQFLRDMKENGFPIRQIVKGKSDPNNPGTSEFKLVLIEQMKCKV